MSLVTKIYFPREILPMASIAAAFLDFLVASLILLGMMLFYHVPLYWTLLWLPLLVALQVVLTCGLVLLASAVNVFYRDVRFVVPLAVQLWMYATPIIYPVTLVPERLRTLYMLNPMAVIIDGYRRAILLGKPPEYAFLGLSALIALIILLLGYGFFKRAEIGMADII
jgi:lipopolysaccharide transport system permease protein